MKNLFINSTISFVLLILSFSISAQEMEDVIYLGNGSIIRGVIIENRPSEGIYKIQSSNGNVFVYKAKEIDKITKEVKDGAAQSGVVVNINNNNTNTNNNDNKAAAPTSVAIKAPQAIQRSHSIGVGTFAHVFTYSGSDSVEDSSLTFSGQALTYQYGFNNHFAIRGYLYSTTNEDYDDDVISGYEVQLLLSTNVKEEGWKFYIGVGTFKETEKFESNFVSEEDDFNGNDFLFGLGYNFDRIAIDLSVSIRSVEDYGISSEFKDDFAVASGSMSATFRY